MPRSSTYVLAVITYFAMAIAQAGNVYKWVDENGKVHYSDQAPQKSAQSVEEVKVNTSVKQNPELQQFHEQNRQWLRALDEKRQQDAKELTAKQEKDAERKAACQRWRKEYNQAMSSGYLYEWDKKGEKVIYSDDEKLAYEKKLRTLINKHCG